MAERQGFVTRPVTLIGAATAFSLLGDQMLYSVLPTAYEGMGLLPYQVGLILSMNRWIRLLTNHLAERICRTHDLARVAGLAFAAGALVTFTYALEPRFWLLLVARLAWGLCWSFIRQIGVMTVADGAPAGRIGRMMGFYSGISRTGSVAGNLAGAVGHDLFGFAATMVVFGVVSLVAVPVGVLARRDVAHRDVPLRPEGFDAASPGLIVCGFLVGAVGHGMMMSTLGLVMRETVGDGLQIGTMMVGVATLTGLLLAARWVADLLGAPVLGHLSDVMGRRGSATVYFGAGCVALVTGAMTSGLLMLVAAVAGFFLCAVGVTTVLIAEAGSRGPKTVASYVTASDVGAAAGPVLGWSVQQAAMSTDFIFGIGGGLYAIGAIVAWRSLSGK